MIAGDHQLGRRYSGGFARRARGYRGYSGFGWDAGQQQSWCASNYPDAANNAACMDNSFPKSLTPPWTDAGRIARGLPGAIGHAIDDTGKLIGGGPSTSSPPGGSGTKAGTAGGMGGSSTVLGIPRKMALVGGGLLAAGVALVVLKKRRK